MKSVDHQARLQLFTNRAAAIVAPVMMPGLVVCPAGFLEQMASPRQAYMAAVYQVAYAAVRRSVQREAEVRRRGAEPSMN